jgi:hypothetical protein
MSRSRKSTTPTARANLGRPPPRNASVADVDVAARPSGDRPAEDSSSLDLAALTDLPLAQLQTLWARHIGRARAPTQRRLLARELAWRIQARTLGGLDVQTARLLKAAVRAAEREDRQAQRTVREVRDADDATHAIEAHDHRPRPTRRSPRPSRAIVTTGPSGNHARGSIPAGVRLVRTWHGRRHEVTVLDGGRAFRYAERTYASLSEIARLITGTRWSGPRFFGFAPPPPHPLPSTPAPIPTRDTSARTTSSAHPRTSP